MRAGSRRLPVPGLTRDPRFKAAVRVDREAPGQARGGVSA
jgi:hypothetical protein